MRLGVLIDEGVSARDASDKLNIISEIIFLSSIVTDKSENGKKVRVWAVSKGLDRSYIDSPDWIQEIQSGESKMSDLLADCDAILAIFSSETGLTTFLTKRVVREALLSKKGLLSFIFNTENPSDSPETAKERFLRSLNDAKDRK